MQLVTYCHLQVSELLATYLLKNDGFTNNTYHKYLIDIKAIYVISHIIM